MPKKFQISDKMIRIKTNQSLNRNIDIEKNDATTVDARGGHNQNARIQKMLENTKNNVVSFKDYEKNKILGDYIAENHYIPVALPLTLSLTTIAPLNTP